MTGWIRRHGMALIGGGALLGILAPPLAEATRPLLLWVSLATMALALLRVEPAALGGVVRRPALALLVLGWVTLGVPLVAYVALAPFLAADSPFLAAAVLIAATPSVMSAAVFAILLGADAALLTLVAIPSNALAPVWLPLTASLMGVSAQVDPWAMALRLAVLVGGSFALAGLALRLVGRATLRARAPAIDTAIVLLVASSAIPCMDGVGAALAARPFGFVAMLGFALALNLALQALGFLVFRAMPERIFVASPRQGALSAGLVSGTRNMVLLLAALGDPGDSELGLIVAAAQLSLFVMPAIVAPAYRALARPT
jgi:BASS family bile acid:Na+ symporter